MRVAVGSDHAGRGLRELIAAHLRAQGHEVREAGPTSDESVDYPLIAERIGQGVAKGDDDRGLLICGSGTGMAMAANRLLGVRAAVCTNELMARLSRAHNDANVLCLGERLIGPGLALAIVDTFMTSNFEGGRHSRRVAQIEALGGSAPK